MSNPSSAGAEKRPRTHAEINEYRRRTLIEGALRSLAERGVAGTTVATISKEAGASRGLLGRPPDVQMRLCGSW